MEREKLSRDTTGRCAEKTQLPTPSDCMSHSIRVWHSPSPHTPPQCPFCTEDMFSCPSAKGQHMSCGTRVCNNVVGTIRWRSHSMAGTNWGPDNHSRHRGGMEATLHHLGTHLHANCRRSSLDLYSSKQIAHLSSSDSYPSFTFLQNKRNKHTQVSSQTTFLGAKKTDTISLVQQVLINIPIL